MEVSKRTPTVKELVDEALALEAGLNRPLRYVQVNSVPYGSTGGIMLRLHRGLVARGIDSRVCWGRGRAAEETSELNFGSKLGVITDAALTRFDGRAGFHSRAATKRLISFMDKFDPDVVHLHNLHGYFVNVEMLFEWLARHRCQVRWTLHDCWAFTGHCAHFTYVKCAQWQSHCAYGKPCPQLDTYPKTISRRSCARNFEDKKSIFTSIPQGRMTLITPSHWLAELVERSFLKDYVVEVRHNTVDGSVFKPTPSVFRERYGIADRFMILGVASPWTERKGLGDFVRLARELDSDRYVIVLIGLSKRQIKVLSSKKIIALPRAKSAQELAEAYTAADVFVHPGLEETFGMTVAEAGSCGTSVIIRKGTACEEAAQGTFFESIDLGFEPLRSAIVRLSQGMSRDFSS